MTTNNLEEKKAEGRVAQAVRQPGVPNSDGAPISNSEINSAEVADFQEDSFQRLYSKELDLDEDEVPVIFHELNDSAIYFIQREQYDRALTLLQKAQTLLDKIQFQRNPNDRLIILITMHNMALCFQKLGALEESSLCLEACLQMLNSPYLQPRFKDSPAKKLRKLKYECKTHMQICAQLSQLHRHDEALAHAVRGMQISQFMVEDLRSLCIYYNEKVIQAKKTEKIAHEIMMNEQNNNQDENAQIMSNLVYYDDSISMLERTAFKLLPIINEVCSKMVRYKENKENINFDPASRVSQYTTTNSHNVNYQENTNVNGTANIVSNGEESTEESQRKINMKSLLGYLNQNEWLYILNIGNITQIMPLTVLEFGGNPGIELELARDSVLEKISFLAVAYFCMSTELRFMIQLKSDPKQIDLSKKLESEYYHAKALDIACSFFPSESPLVSHIMSSYQKHHAPVQQAIPEGGEVNMGLKVVRPLPGIDSSKFQPIIRQSTPEVQANYLLSPLRMSPNNYGKKAVAPPSLMMSQIQTFSAIISPSNLQNNLQSQNTTQQLRKPKTEGTSQQKTQRLDNGQNGKQTKKKTPLNQQHISQRHNQSNERNNSSLLIENQDESIIQNQEQDSIISGNVTLNNTSNNNNNNRSMMDVVPSSKHSQLLNEQQHNSINQQNNKAKTIMDMSNNGINNVVVENSQFFDINDDLDSDYEEDENQEVQQTMQRAVKQKMQISQDIMDYDDDIDNVDEDVDEEDYEDPPGVFDGTDTKNNAETASGNANNRTNKSRKFNNSKQQQNRSTNIEPSGKQKRPQTSQGIRGGGTRAQHLNHSSLEENSNGNKQRKMVIDQSQNQRQQQQQQQRSTLVIMDDDVPVNSKMRMTVHHQQSLQMLTEGISPNSRMPARHNQSMGASGKVGRTGLTTQQSTATVGLEASIQQKNQQRIHTPVKQSTIPKQSKSKENNKGAVNMSRMEERQDYQRNNMGSGPNNTSGVLEVNNSRLSRTKKQRYNQGEQSSSLGRRSNLQEYSTNPISSANQRSNSQQRRLQSSAGKQKSGNQKRQLAANESGRIHEIIMVDQNIKRRGEAGQHPSKSFETTSTINDQRYHTQGSVGQISQSGASLSKQFKQSSFMEGNDKARSQISLNIDKIKQQQHPNANIEDLKRQILLKQALLDSNSNSRRKSTSGLNTHSGSQSVLSGANIKRKSNDHQQQKNVRSTTPCLQMPNQQQYMTASGNSSHAISQQIFNSNEGPNAIQQKGQKQNTHQMIKKFLKDRQSYQQENGKTAYGGQYLNDSSYNLGVQPSVKGDILKAQQLSKKILNQQQLIMNMQHNQQQSNPNNSQSQNLNISASNRQSGGGNSLQFITESHPIKMMKQQTSQQIFNGVSDNIGLTGSEKQIKIASQQQMGQKQGKTGAGSIQRSQLDNSQSTPDMMGGMGNGEILREYFSEMQNQPLVDQSFTKRKKIAKKTTPKNIAAAAQSNHFAWM